MHLVDIEKYKDGMRSFIQEFRFGNPYFVTLTLQFFYNGRRIEAKDCATTFRRFVRMLEKQLHPHSRGTGNTIRVVSCIEINRNDRYHVHAFIDCPTTTDHATFVNAITTTWSRQKMAYKEVDVQRDEEMVHIDYFLKKRTKEATYIDSFDIFNWNRGTTDETRPQKHTYQLA